MLEAVELDKKIREYAQANDSTKVKLFARPFYGQLWWRVEELGNRITIGSVCGLLVRNHGTLWQAHIEHGSRQPYTINMDAGWRDVADWHPVPAEFLGEFCTLETAKYAELVERVETVERLSEAVLGEHDARLTETENTLQIVQAGLQAVLSGPVDSASVEKAPEEPAPISAGEIAPSAEPKKTARPRLVGKT